MNINPSKGLRDKCAIVGIGNSRLGKVPGVSSLDLLVEAMVNALDDAGLKTADIDGLICRGPDDAYGHHQLIGARLGINANISAASLEAVVSAANRILLKQEKA